MDRDAQATIVHLYRAEVARADVWRVRLDNTTNWALTASAAALSIGLGSGSGSHAVFLIGMGIVLNFLVIETRRYRNWDFYLRRVRLLETGFYAPLLRGESPDLEVLRETALMLDAPRLFIPFWAALRQRIKRAYGAVLGVLLLAWIFKLALDYQKGQASGVGLIQLLRIGYIPGPVVLGVVGLLYGTLTVLVVTSLFTKPPDTELRPVRRRRRPLSAVLGGRVKIAPPRDTDPRPSETRH